uniref:Uncharacterized protein n=1 Tax=Romanomermis culicivorax TaxID=13658 RepID=A0A915KLX6_ROMCU
MLPGLTALSSSSSASLRSSNESTLSNINGPLLQQQQHHHSNGGLSPNNSNKIFASASSAGVIAPVLVSLAVGGEAGGVSPINLCAVGQQQHNETVKTQISTKKAKHIKQGGLINFAKKNS